MSRHKHYEPPTMNTGDPTLFEGVTMKSWIASYSQEPPSVPVDTSEAAAQRVRKDTAYWRAEVYAFIRSQGAHGATQREICAALGISGDTGRPRTWELCGNAPAGRPPRVPVIRMTEAKRGGMRVYVVV